MRVQLVRDRTQRADDDEEVVPANSKAGKLLGLGLRLHEAACAIMVNPSDPTEYGELVAALAELASESGVSWLDVEKSIHERSERLGGFSRGMVLIRPKRKGK